MALETIATADAGRRVDDYDWPELTAASMNMAMR